MASQWAARHHFGATATVSASSIFRLIFLLSLNRANSLSHGKCFSPLKGRSAPLSDPEPTASIQPMRFRDGSRRSAIASIGLLPPPILLNPDKVTASQTTAEAIRRSASSIPGYGQPDVYYPLSFLGRWRARREVILSDDPALSSLTPITIVYEIRFIPVDGDGGTSSGAKVVADRGYNEASYRSAVVAACEKQLVPNGVPVPPSVRSYEWSASNPNVLSLLYTDGSSREIKVTKRAADIGPDLMTVSSSEYRRVTDVGGRGIPSISASRSLAKWRTTNDRNILEGIEIIYEERGMGSGDPLAAGPGNVRGGGAPTVSSKSRLRLEKI